MEKLLPALLIHRKEKGFREKYMGLAQPRFLAHLTLTPFSHESVAIYNFLKQNMAIV